MKITNKFNLPEEIVKAVSYSGHKKADYSVTELLNPVKLTILKNRHEEEIEEDASERIWTLFGNAVHYILQKGEGKESLVEQYLTTAVLGRTISGMADLYHNGKVTDYKTTSVYTVMKADRIQEWTDQLNIYAYLYHLAGFEVNALQIVAMLKDWSRSKAKYDMSYPQSAVKVIDIELKDFTYTMDRIIDIVCQLTEAEKLKDDELPECTPEQMWESGDIFAVMKKGRKSALKLFTDRVSADIYAEDNKGYVQERKGKRARCEDYCPVNKWCKQYQEYKGGQE